MIKIEINNDRYCIKKEQEIMLIETNVNLDASYLTKLIEKKGLRNFNVRIHPKGMAVNVNMSAARWTGNLERWYELAISQAILQYFM